MMDVLNYDGLILGLCTFLIIGLFHPIVIKTEYYLGVKVWWIFLVAGIAGIIVSLMIESSLLSALCGIVAFSSFWSIKELFDQKKRVEKGWYPKRKK